MGQREDVAASLMRGDSRDGCARRKVADQVKAVVYGDGDPTTVHAVATAASAVVLASDLRAPADDPAADGDTSARRGPEIVALAEKFRAENHEPVADESTFGAVQAIYREAGRDVLRREGWRARLANVERLLDRATDQGIAGDDPEASRALEAALAEIRAMIDGEGE